MSYRIIKTCGCGKTYNRKTWRKLKLIAHQHVPKDSHGPQMNLELRDCSCGSTLAIEVTRAVTLKALGPKGLSKRYS